MTSKIIGISGSPRNKNTDYMVRTVCESAGDDCEIINLRDLDIKHCDGCLSCQKTHKCVIKDDMQAMYEKLKAADAIILGSPTYFDNVSGLMKNFIDRCLPFYFSGELKDKPVALLAVGNLPHNEKDENGDCKWHAEEKESIELCVNALDSFAVILEMKIIDKIYAMHSEPESKRQQLIELGKRLSVH